MNPTKRAKHSLQVAARKQLREQRNIDKGIPRDEPKTNKQEPRSRDFTRLERIALTGNLNIR